MSKITLTSEEQIDESELTERERAIYDAGLDEGRSLLIIWIPVSAAIGAIMLAVIHYLIN